MSEITLEDLRCHFQTGRSYVKSGEGRNRVYGYRTGIQCNLGDIEKSEWMQMVRDVIDREGEQELQRQLLEHRKAHNYAKQSIWPCFEEYRDNEYSSDPGKAYLLISVFERDISTEPFPTLDAARIAMLAELKTEFLKENEEAEWDEIMAHDEFECDSFGFGKQSAWSNLDDDCNCDWQIIPIPPTII